jgi:hypothetical protein
VVGGSCDIAGGTFELDAGPFKTKFSDRSSQGRAKIMKLHGILIIVATMTSAVSIAAATEQQQDTVAYGDHEYGILQRPIADLWYFGEGQPPQGMFRHPDFEWTITSNRAGYTVAWEIRNHQLLLTKIHGTVKAKDVKNEAILPGLLTKIRGTAKLTDVVNEAILPGLTFPAVARWFTGKIHIAVGGFNQDAHEFEAIIVFEIDKGDVKSMAFVPAGQISRERNGL